MSTEMKDNTKILIENAIEPQVWKEYVEKDRMKFWDRPEAYCLKGVLFPTYCTNSGEDLPKDPADLCFWNCFSHDWQSAPMM